MDASTESRLTVLVEELSGKVDDLLTGQEAMQEFLTENSAELLKVMQDIKVLLGVLCLVGVSWILLRIFWR